MSNETLQSKLDEKIPRSAVKERDGGGGVRLSYIGAEYVTDRLNQIFGSLGWSKTTIKLDKVFEGQLEQNGRKKHTVSYIAQVRLVVTVDGKGTEHTTTGHGTGFDVFNPGAAHELAVKAAETDAFKRAASNLGQSMGLALYDKEQKNIEEDDQSQPIKEALKKAPAFAAKNTSNNAGTVLNSGTVNEPAKTTLGSSKNSVLTLIAAASKNIIERQKKTIDELKGEMKTRYGTDVKEQLNETQAKEFAAYLGSIN